MAHDPVCGMEIEPGQAGATVEHHGQDYQFCSNECREEFERNPEQYTQKSA